MKLTSYKTGLLVCVAVAVCAGLAVAQQGGWPGRRTFRGPEAGPPAGRQMMRGPTERARPGLETLLTAEDMDVQVVKTDAGVELTITTTKPDLVPRLQRVAQTGVERLERFGAAGPEAGLPQGDLPVRSGRILSLVWSGDLIISARDIDDGVVVSFTSDNADVVTRIHEHVPQWVSETAERQEGGARGARRMAQSREALTLLASDKVKLEVKETDKGITINVTSDDPEVAKQIREKLPAYYEGQKDLAGRAQQWMGRGQQWMRRGPQGMGRGQQGPAGPRGEQGRGGRRRAAPDPLRQ